jgi:hypothetical protein
MAAIKKSLIGTAFLESTPKKSRQGEGKHTKYAASSRNKARKRYRGQGK